MQLKTFKPYYFNGQVVRGYGAINLFNKVKAKDIYFWVKGYEIAGENHAQVLKNFKASMKNASIMATKSANQLQQIIDMTGSMARNNTDLVKVYGDTNSKAGS